MSGRIPQNFIDELLSRIDIVDLIDGYLPLKKNGREYVACCPFHSEKTPSFTVSPTKQFYHCFGCGAHGTAIGFLMEYEHLNYREAIESLAQKLKIEIPHEGRSSVESVQKSVDNYELLAKATDFYRLSLRRHQPAIKYLKGRGLTGEIALRYVLGYAPAAWDALIRHLQPVASADVLVSMGLVIRKDEGGYYDRFRNRIMFPLRDTRGRVIGFGGRIIDEGAPKYLNSPETDLFHKGRLLYGWYEARKTLGKIDKIVVVEGYMDVVALAQYGVQNAVATLGTATTREHIRQIFRSAHEIVFCFDGDRAGRSAAWRALENLLPEFRDGVNAHFMFLPEGDDPDSLIRREGLEGWSKRVAHATPLDSYLLATLQDTQLVGAGARAQLVARAKPLINLLQDGVFKERLMIELGKLAGVSLDKLAATLAGVPQTSALTEDKFSVQRTPVRLAIALLLNQPALAGGLPELAWLKTLELPGIPLLMEIIETLQSNPHISSASLIERYRHSEHYRHLSKLMEWTSPQDNVGDQQALFLDVIGMLDRKRRDQRTDQLLIKARGGKLSIVELAELRRLLYNNAPGAQRANHSAHS
jgi:DNA primase